ncbi:MAG: hypothetical protein Q9191_001827 [Dirinaria sp. TL-2023a]
MTRERLKLCGMMTAGAIRQLPSTTAEQQHVGEVHMAIKVEQSLDEHSAGYDKLMRDDDPQSLNNDDFVRTFTVSSAVGLGTHQDELELTIRNVDSVTGLLFQQHIRAGLEVALKGFGGSFTVKQIPGQTVSIVAGSIGIAPILAHLPYRQLVRVGLIWAINVQSIALVDTFLQHPALLPSTTL